MRKPTVKKIFARTNTDDFIGRTSLVAELSELARSGSGGLVLLASPSAGSSELLRHVYDRLFFEQEEVIPFYFEVRRSDRTAQNAALRFLCEFLLQTVAFRRRDTRIIDASPEIAEIANLAVPEDGHWIDRLVDTYTSDNKVSDDRSFIRNCLSSPLRAASNGAHSFVLIDDLHLVYDLEGGDAFFDDLVSIFERSSIPFVLSGSRRSIFAQTPFETRALDVFSFDESGAFIEHLSRSNKIETTDQTRDLIAVQLGGNAGHMALLFAAASAKGAALSTFEEVQQVYTNEIFGGRIGRYFDKIFDDLIPDAGLQAKALWLLTENLEARDSRIPTTYWNRHSGLSNIELERLLEALHHREIISLASGSVEIDKGNFALCDYLLARKRLEIDDESRALAVGDALAENVRRAPQLMATFYRRTSAIGLRRLLTAFAGREVSSGLLDYSKFKEKLKGGDDAEILLSFQSDPDTVSLPQIVYTANTSAFYPKLNELCEPERSAVGLGFKDKADKEETVWIAVQIDSKLEVKRELAEFWCDRLEMAAVNSGFADHRLWLISPEGFDHDAMLVLREREAFGSSRKQIDLLAKVLDADLEVEIGSTAEEYEIVVPMGGDTEMIAAHTVEEIAKRHDFPTKAINQIKTALVEACINASEHSLSPDRRIHQKFVVEADKITITVTNRGVRLIDKQPGANGADEDRRGWGLKLMRGLMDEVSIDKTDDGTRITMVKYLHRAVTADAA